MNASLSWILVAIKKSPENKNVRFPNVPEGKTLGIHYDKYCEFHKTKGHHTNDCEVLAKEVHAPIKAEKFRQFVKGVTKRTDQRDEPKEKPRDDRKYGKDRGIKVMVIKGGDDHELPSKKARCSDRPLMKNGVSKANKAI